MPTRSARSGQSTPAKKPVSQRKTAAPRTSRRTSTKATSLRREEEPAEEESDQEEDYDAYPGDADDTDDDDAASLHSDALDEDSDAYTTESKKRKRVSASPSKVKDTRKVSAKKSSPRKRSRKVKESDEEDHGIDLKEGQEIVGVVVKAPTTGRGRAYAERSCDIVPPGQVSCNTLDFLSQLKNPDCNDREWFKLHEPVYRVAEKEWKDFIEEFTSRLVDIDPQIPHLPPKDVIHRIYRDIRFSNDKTPYKTGLSASFSRSGRKGIFAAYHIAIKPGGESLIAAGSWCPGKNELATIRSNIQRSSRRLKDVISSPEFVRYFGEPKPLQNGGRRNIFGSEDELKVAPKGVDKTHKDIDLLKCRSFAVVHRFLDSEVLAPDFQDAVCKVVRVVQPLVHCLNDMMTLQDAGDTESDGDEQAESGSEDE